MNRHIKIERIVALQSPKPSLTRKLVKRNFLLKDPNFDLASQVKLALKLRWPLLNRSIIDKIKWSVINRFRATIFSWNLGLYFHLSR